MRRPLALSLVSAVIVVVLGGIGAARADASCVALLYWHGGPYQGHGDAQLKTRGPLADAAIRPGCNDIVGPGAPPPQPDTPVTVRRIAGVDPRVAFVDQDRQVYVNASTFPQLPSHPLHEQLGSRPLGWRSAAPCRVSGTAVVDFGNLGLKRGKETARIRVHATTDVQLQRYGTGYVPNGAAITVQGQRCARNGDVLWIDAKRISRRR